MIIAHATKLRRIHATALRRAMQLTGFCELCGASTYLVAFWNGGQFAEICTACAAEANRHVKDESK